MKIMLSQPRKNLTEQEFIINKTNAINEVESLGHTVIKPCIRANEASRIKNMYTYYLSRTLLCISDVDGVYFLNGWDKVDSCRLEHEVCKTYNVPIFYEPFASNFTSNEEIV